MPRGWEHLSDEFALIEPNTRDLRPFPKPVCVKAGFFGTGDDPRKLATTEQRSSRRYGAAMYSRMRRTRAALRC